MTEEQWGPIAGRIALAWGAFDEERRRLYFEVLEDLDASAVERAVDELIREGREQVPPPGVVRQLAVARSESAVVPDPMERTDEGAGSEPPAPEAPPPEATPGLSVADIFGAQLPPHPPVEIGEPETGPKLPFNWLALFGLLVPLVLGLIPRFGMAAAEGEDAPDMPIELIVTGAIGLGLAIPGLHRAGRKVRRGRGLPVAGIVVSAIALVAGFGSLATFANDSSERREVAEALDADRSTVSEADLSRVRNFDRAIQEWNAAAADVFFGYQEAATPQEINEWVASAPGWIAGMQAAHQRMRRTVDAISDPGIRDTLNPFVRTFGRQTTLAGRLHGAVRDGSADRERAAGRELQDEAEAHGRIARSFQEKIEAVRRAS